MSTHRTAALTVPADVEPRSLVDLVADCREIDLRAVAGTAVPRPRAASPELCLTDGDATRWPDRAVALAAGLADYGS